MVDIEAAIGYVVARGDEVDRARLSWLRNGTPAPEDVVSRAESGQTPDGGWPAVYGGDIASVDATCFRIDELEDLGALARPPAQRALQWLAARQRPNGMWEEDAGLADVAPAWAQPGDPEARLYLTATAAYWLLVSGGKAAEGSDELSLSSENDHDALLLRAAEAFRAELRPDGSWPSFLATGWLGGALMHHFGWYYEAAQIQSILLERVPEMSPQDTAAMGTVLRRFNSWADERLLAAMRKRLSETQRPDGGWPSEDGDAFDVHTTLSALRAAR